jgi:hypothetical protein
MIYEMELKLNVRLKRTHISVRMSCCVSLGATGK